MSRRRAPVYETGKAFQRCPCSMIYVCSEVPATWHLQRHPEVPTTHATMSLFICSTRGFTRPCKCRRFTRTYVPPGVWQQARPAHLFNDRRHPLLIIMSTLALVPPVCSDSSPAISTNVKRLHGNEGLSFVMATNTHPCPDHLFATVPNRTDEITQQQTVYMRVPTRSRPRDSRSEPANRRST